MAASIAAALAANGYLGWAGLEQDAREKQVASDASQIGRLVMAHAQESSAGYPDELRQRGQVVRVGEHRGGLSDHNVMVYKTTGEEFTVCVHNESAWGLFKSERGAMDGSGPADRLPDECG